MIFIIELTYSAGGIHLWIACSVMRNLFRNLHICNSEIFFKKIHIPTLFHRNFVFYGKFTRIEYFSQTYTFAQNIQFSWKMINNHNREQTPLILAKIRDKRAFIYLLTLICAAGSAGSPKKFVTFWGAFDCRASCWI